MSSRLENDSWKNSSTPYWEKVFFFSSLCTYYWCSTSESQSLENNLKLAYRRGIKIWCWEQEFWSKSLSLGLPFGFPTLDLDFGKLFNCSQPQFPHTGGCLLRRMAVRVQRENAQSLVMLLLNVGREGFLRFSPRKILGQEEGQDPCSFIAEASGSKWFHPIHRAWKWWAAAAGSLPTRPCDFWETGQVSFELSVLLKMQSSTCAERVPGVGVPSPSDHPGA